MPALQYPPHITLAIYDEIPVADLFSACDSTLKFLQKVTVRFESLGYFETPHAVILWAAPNLPDSVRAAHEHIHSQIDVEQCRRNYRPGNWVPHCSLATSIDLSRKEQAIELARSPIEPIEVTFDVADCASFLPVKVMREAHLR